MSRNTLNWRWHSIFIKPLIASIVGGCAAPGVVTEAEQAERLAFVCPNGRNVAVTRVNAGQMAIVVVDGQALQLPRVSVPGERYSNRIQTLNIYGEQVTFESLGQAASGPCSLSPPFRPRPRGDRD